MKNNYVENFVNPRYYVYLDFDKLMSCTESEKKSISIPRTMLAIVMFVTMIVCIVHHWWIALTFSALLAFFSFPKTSCWLQNAMKVEFPNMFFWIVSFFLLVALVGSIGMHKYEDDMKLAKAVALAEQQRQAEIAEKLEKERVAKEKEQQRLDSLSYHLNLAQLKLDERKKMDALKEFELALPFTDSESKSTISYKIAEILFANKKYEEALRYYWYVKNDPARLDTLNYNRAICFVQTGDIASAVSELRQSIWSKRGEILFNKINPVKTRVRYVDNPVKKKRVAYHIILCGDGSTSHSSSRRGTCSRHGGVADWSHPIYETYTENQKKKVIEKYREYGEY